MKETILLVEDEVDVIKANRRLLERRNCNVLTATTVKDAINLLVKHEPNLLILDIMLPDGSGYEICDFFRKSSDNPILFLSAKNEVTSKIDGLKHGGDYYITKPYNFDELYAVIERLLQREQELSKKQKTVIKIGDLTFDIIKSTVAIKGEFIRLTKIEFTLLSILIQNKNKEFKRDELYSLVWGSQSNEDTRVLSKHISKLRQKIDCENSDAYDIISSYGKGYTFLEG